MFTSSVLIACACALWAGPAPARAHQAHQALSAAADDNDCALYLTGPGRTSAFDYNLNLLRGNFAYDGQHTCITYDAINQAYLDARKRINVAQPKGDWKSEDIASVGELMLDISISLARTYGLTYEEIEKGLPLIDTSKTLIRDACPPVFSHVECRPGKYRRFDGLCNNLQHPTWGATMAPFQRLIGPLFADGINAPRISTSGHELPLSRVVSRTMHPDDGFHDHAGTVMVIAWGQFMDHDYTLTATPLDPRNRNDPEECCKRPPHLKHPYCNEIRIPDDDYFYRLFNVKCIDFVRGFPSPRPGCKLGSRVPFNTLTGVIDGNTVYGVTEKFARKLRTGFGGLLRMNPVFEEYGLKDLLPLKLDIPDEGCTRPNKSMYCFEAGEIRVNEQLVLTVMHTLMAREHNRVAKGLAGVNAHWDDETLFQEARRINIAEIQHITFNEFLPILLGKDVMDKFGLLLQKEGYWDGYDPSVNPDVIDSFASAAYRFGHSLLPTAVERWSKAHKFIASKRLSDLIRRPYDLYRAGVLDEYIMGLMNQVAQAMDDSITQEVTNHLFKKVGARFGMDLVSFNMQRGREFGVPGYMEFRKFCGLPGADTFQELFGSMPNETIRKYESIFEHPSDVDLWSGGVSERPLPGSMLGPTFACIIATQFSYSRRGDRFWYELQNQPSSFTPEQLREVKKARLSRIICDNTDIIDTVQVYPMVLPDHELNPRVPCRSGIIPSMDFSVWAEHPTLDGTASRQYYTNALFSNKTDIPENNCTLENATEKQTEKPVEKEIVVCDNSDPEESVANDAKQNKQEHVTQTQTGGAIDNILKYVKKINKNAIPTEKPTGHQKNALKRRKRNLSPFDEPDTIVTTTRPDIKEDLKATAAEVFSEFRPLPILPEGYLERFNITPKQLDFISNMFNKNIEIRITDKTKPTQSKTSYDPPIYDKQNKYRNVDEDIFDRKPTGQSEDEAIAKNTRKIKNTKHEETEDHEKIIHSSNHKPSNTFEEKFISEEITRKLEEPHKTVTDKSINEWELPLTQSFKYNPAKEDFFENGFKIPSLASKKDQNYHESDDEENSEEDIPHNRFYQKDDANNEKLRSSQPRDSSDELEDLNSAGRVRKPEIPNKNHSKEEINDNKDNDGISEQLHNKHDKNPNDNGDTDIPEKSLSAHGSESASDTDEFIPRDDNRSTKTLHNKYYHKSDGNDDSDDDAPEKDKHIRERKIVSSANYPRPSSERNTNSKKHNQDDDENQPEIYTDDRKKTTNSDVSNDDEIGPKNKIKKNSYKENEYDRTQKPERRRLTHDREFTAHPEKFPAESNSKNPKEPYQRNYDDDDEDEESYADKLERLPKTGKYPDKRIPSDESRGNDRDDNHDDDKDNEKIPRSSDENESARDSKEFRPRHVSRNPDKSYEKHNNEYIDERASTKQKNVPHNEENDQYSDVLLPRAAIKTSEKALTTYNQNIEDINDKPQKPFISELKKIYNEAGTIDESKSGDITSKINKEKDVRHYSDSDDDDYSDDDNNNDDKDRQVPEREGSLDDIRPTADNNNPDKWNPNDNGENTSNGRPQKLNKPVSDSHGVRPSDKLLFENSNIDNEPRKNYKEVHNSDDDRPREAPAYSKKSYRVEETSDDEGNPDKSHPTLGLEESVDERLAEFRENSKTAHENYSKHLAQKPEKHIFYPPVMSLEDLKPKNQEKIQKYYSTDSPTKDDIPQIYNLNTPKPAEEHLDYIKPTANGRFLHRRYNDEESSDEDIDGPQKHSLANSQEKLDRNDHDKLILREDKQAHTHYSDSRPDVIRQEKYDRIPKNDNEKDDIDSHRPHRQRFRPAYISEASLGDTKSTEQETRSPEKARQGYHQDDISEDTTEKPKTYSEKNVNYEPKPTVLTEIKNKAEHYKASNDYPSKSDTFKIAEESISKIYNKIPKPGSVNSYVSGQGSIKSAKSQIYNPGYKLAYVSQHDLKHDPIKSKTYNQKDSENKYDNNIALNVPKPLHANDYGDEDISDTPVHNFNRKLQSVGSSEEEDTKPVRYDSLNQKEDRSKNDNRLSSENISQEIIGSEKAEDQGRRPIISYETYHNQENDDTRKMLDFTPKYKSADITREYFKQAEGNKRPEVSYEVYHKEKVPNSDLNPEHRSGETSEENFNPLNEHNERKASKLTSYVDKDFAVFDKLHPRAYNEYLPPVNTSTIKSELPDLATKDRSGNVKQQFEKIPLDYMHDKHSKPKGNKPLSYVQNVDEDESSELIDNTDKDEEKQDTPEPSKGVSTFDRELETRFDDGKLNLPEIKLPESVLGYYESPKKESENEEDEKEEVRKESDDDSSDDEEKEEHLDKTGDNKEDYKRTIDTEYDDLYGKFFNDNVDLYESFVQDNFNKKGTFKERSEKVVQDPVLKDTIKDVLDHTTKNMNDAEKNKNPKYGYMWTMNYGKPS